MHHFFVGVFEEQRHRQHEAHDDPGRQQSSALSAGGLGQHCVNQVAMHRTLVEAEIAARDASNTANRLKTAAFPVTKTLDGFDVTGSSITQATFDYRSSLE